MDLLQFGKKSRTRLTTTHPFQLRLFDFVRLPAFGIAEQATVHGLVAIVTRSLWVQRGCPSRLADGLLDR
jgi:hypothetical protein